MLFILYSTLPCNYNWLFSKLSKDTLIFFLHRWQRHFVDWERNQLITNEGNKLYFIFFPLILCHLWLLSHTWTQTTIILSAPHLYPGRAVPIPRSHTCFGFPWFGTKLVHGAESAEDFPFRGWGREAKLLLWLIVHHCKIILWEMGQIQAHTKALESTCEFLVAHCSCWCTACSSSNRYKGKRVEHS